MQVIPALDLLGEDAVRLEQGDFDRVLFRRPYEELLTLLLETSPAMIHVVDLQGARDGAIRLDVLARCRVVAGATPLQVSGGVRSVAIGRAALLAGASRVVVGTAIWEEDGALSMFVDALGEQLVVAIDVKDGRLATRGWAAYSAIDVDEALARCQRAGVTRLHVTAVERDGTLRGPDLALYERACASGLKVVAAGGVRDDGDLETLGAIGCEAAVMGVGYLARLGRGPN